MKVVTEFRQVESTIQGEHIGMSINPEDMPKILSLLTDLYEDPKMAVLREYSTNALDSHVEAGQTRPIEITLPTQLAPQLRIKDYGVGLDADGVRTIYSKYGASTKTDSNDLIGALGLGCKSAWTYTDHFTISAVKDGVKIEVSASRNEDAGAKLKIVDEYETDEPNGVEIIIPVNAEDYRWGSYGFAEKAAELFKYWPKGTVLVDGEEPSTVWDDESGFWIADDLLITEKSGDEDVVVMGGVPYRFPDEYKEWNRRYTITAFVEIGKVNFPPNRESLMLNKQTRETLDNILQRIKDETGPAISKQIEEAESRPEAIKLYHESISLFRDQVKPDVQYKGKPIPTSMDAPVTGKTTQPFVVVKSTDTKSQREKGWHRMNAFPSSLWDKTLFIRGYDGADFSPYKRKKMDQWIEQHFNGDCPEYTTVVFTSKVPNHHWIEKDRIHKWDDIKNQKIIRENVRLQNGRVSGTYEGYINGTREYEIKAEDIDTTKPVLYLDKTRHYEVSRTQLNIINEASDNEFTLVEMGSNRIQKFQREFPMAKSVNDYIKKLATDWADSLTDDEKLNLVINDAEANSYSRIGLENLRGLDLDDPDLKFAVDQISNRQTNLKKNYERYSPYVTIDKGIDWKNPLDNYPLLQHVTCYGTMSGSMQKEITIYLNAAYAASQEEAS